MPTMTLAQIKILINALEKFKHEKKGRLLAEARLKAAFGEDANLRPKDVQALAQELGTAFERADAVDKAAASALETTGTNGDIELDNHRIRQTSDSVCF